MPRATRIATILILGLLLPATLALGFDLTILHTNDVHGRLVQFSKHGQLCAINATNCFGGMARISAEAAKHRATNRNVLLLDAGDQFQGSWLFWEFKGQAAATLMNLARYDAMAVGNHEFDNGVDVLARFAKTLNFPLLSCNIDFASAPALEALVPPYTILKRQGRSIGIIGCITPTTKTLSKGALDIRFESPAKAVARSVQALRSQGIDIIILLSHLGYEADRHLAQTVDGPDIIVGGHSHTPLGDMPGAVGPYPTVETGPNGHPVLIVTAGEWARFLGALNVSFDQQGTPTSWTGEPIDLQPERPRDQRILAEANHLQTKLGNKLKQKIGTIAQPLGAELDLCRTAQCDLGNLVTDAMLKATKPAGVQVALFNAGGLRAGLAKGPVTLVDLITVLPFGNTIEICTLTGANLKTVLEHSLSQATTPKADGTGRFLQIAGLRLTWAPKKPVGARVISMEIRDENGHCTPVLPTAQYRVAINDYMASGGDGYNMLQKHTKDSYDTSQSVVSAFAELLKANDPLIAPRDKRIIAKE